MGFCMALGGFTTAQITGVCSFLGLRSDAYELIEWVGG